MNSFYNNLEKEFNVIDDLKFSNMVHAQNHKNKPFHRWAHYKEGFDDSLLDYYFQKWNINKNSNILDPFSGSGTTLLYAQQHHCNSYGFEVNPYSHLLTEVKLHNWTVDDFEDIKNHISKMKELKAKIGTYSKPFLPRIDDIFEEPYLSELLCYRDYIFSIENEKQKSFFLIGLLTIIEYNANARKFCSGLRYIQRKNKNVYKMLFEKYEIMLEDIQEKQNNNTYQIYLDSSLNADKYLKENSIDAFITSPPYANTFDYTNIYKMELWFGNFVSNTEDMKNLRAKMLRSHVSNKPIEDNEINNSQLSIKNELNIILSEMSKEKLWNRHIPKMIWAYFEDTNILLNKIHASLKNNGKGAIVVANSVYNGVVVPTDLLISKLAIANGYKVNEIKVARYINYESSNNLRKPLLSDSKYIRESIIELSK